MPKPSHEFADFGFCLFLLIPFCPFYFLELPGLLPVYEGTFVFFPFCILLNLFTNQKRKRKNNILLMPNIPYLIGSQIFPVNNMEHKLVSYTTPKKIPL